MPDPSPMLPVLERRDEIRSLIERSQVVVLCGATGSGKTTQLPQICLDMGLRGVIGHTQPRRIAARAVAGRIAEERGEAVGSTVGVKVRFHDLTGRRTRIKVLTDGMLLAELGSDAQLSDYGVIILDEAHERSLNIDFLLGYLRGLAERRPDLKIIITSATIDPERFSRQFGGPSRAPIIEVSGRLFPVEIRYRPPSDDAGPASPEVIADAVEDLPGGRGDVLVFLPGEREIRLAADAIARRRLGLEVLPLFSRLNQQDQDRIFHPGGARRVILATNVAETSLTVPGIRYVVDSGLARLARYDPARKVQGLPIEEISRASADQRAGRCGRVEAGVCIRLYSEASYKARPAFTDPEIRRTSLASVILRMKSLGLGRVERFPFLDPPDAAAVRDGHETLFELGATASTDADAPLTETGVRMSRIPADPRIARMLLAGHELRVLPQTTVLAAALAIQDPRERPMARQEEADRAQTVFRSEKSDFLTLLNLWDQYTHAESTMSRGAVLGWCRDHFLSAARMREWREMANQLERICEDLELSPVSGPATEDDLHKALLTGLISNVGCREGEAGSFEYRGVRGNKLQIFPGSVLFKRGPKWIMAAELAHTTRLYARTVARIEPEWIEQLAGHMFRHQVSDPHFDPETGEASAWERITMSGIVVVPRRRTGLARLDPAAARDLLIREGLVRGRLNLDLPFLEANRRVMQIAATAEARLRRRDVRIDDDTLANWFSARLPADIVTAEQLQAWYAEAHRGHAKPLLELEPRDVIRAESAVALDEARFPGTLVLDDQAGDAPIEYIWAPGRDDDGLTVTVGLEQLPALPPGRIAWLVPGWFEELILALLKTLPKAQRARIEAREPLAETAKACAELVTFGSGELVNALSEAVAVVAGVTVPPQEWNFKSLPLHLRARVRVMDDAGRELAADRDLGQLLTRFEARIGRARAARARVMYERAELREWTFGPLVERVETESGERFPSLVDEGDSARLTLLGSPDEAAAMRHGGVRRLFAIACEDELIHYVESLPAWRDMLKQHAPLGSDAGLRADVMALAADRVFLDGQSMPTNEPEFQERLAANRGRLPVAAREVGESVARVLEARSKLAQRLSGGTPRLWAESVADIREHAAFLMPRGFLRALPWERVRSYPRYAETMRARLFALREEGVRAETESLRLIAPHWKRFTGWVAAAMSAERARAEEAPKDRKGAAKAPLPQARRAAPVVNIEAGEWAMSPGRLPSAVRRFRWLLEEARATLFGPAGPGDWPALEQELKRAWAAVDAARNE